MNTDSAAIKNIDGNVANLGNDFNRLKTKIDFLENAVKDILANQAVIVKNQSLILEEIRKSR